MAKEKNDKTPTINEGDLRSLLQEYREKAGYSLTQMAEALCLSDDTLLKLEGEDFQELAEPPYIRGYLRNYAKLAEEDSSQLINVYESLRGANPADLDYHFKAKPKILTDSKRRISPVMGQLLLLSLLLAFLVGISMIPAVNNWIINTWNSFSEQSQSQRNTSINLDNQDLIGSMPIPQPLPIENQAVAEEEGKKETLKTSETKNASDTTSPSQTPSTKTSEVSQTNNTTEEPTTEQTTNNNSVNSTEAQTKLLTPEALSEQNTTDDDINVKLIFNSEVWMRIKDKNNKTVFEGLNTTGGSKTLILSKPLHFRVGNAHGLSLFVDDQPMDISGHIKGSVAKFSLE